MFDDTKRATVRDWSDKTQIAEYLKKILIKEAFDGSGLILWNGRRSLILSLDPREV